MKYKIFIYAFCIFFSCNQKSNHETNLKQSAEQCPCDSIGRFNDRNQSEIQYFFGKSLISMKSKKGNDTVNVTRYYTTDTVWHVQEYILVTNNQMVYPKFAIYCDLKDTANFYKLTFIKNDSLKRNPNLIFKKNIGSRAIMGSDSIDSKELSVFIPKKKFHGVIKFDKIYQCLHQGKNDTAVTSIFVDADKMVKYGNIIEQYYLIKKLCERE